jgi:hypothetical protein
MYCVTAGKPSCFGGNADADVNRPFSSEYSGPCGGSIPNADSRAVNSGGTGACPTEEFTQVWIIC